MNTQAYGFNYEPCQAMGTTSDFELENDRWVTQDTRYTHEATTSTGFSMKQSGCGEMK